MRRLTWLAPAAVALTLAAAPATASADLVDDLAPDAVVLAADAETATLGPDPQPREDPNNQATLLGGYEDPDVQFTWAASFLLLGGVVSAIVVGGSLWYLLVVRPTKRAATS